MKLFAVTLLTAYSAYSAIAIADECEDEGKLTS